MAEEMIESAPWESEEADYSEADEAIAEAEDSTEDYRRNRRPRRPFLRTNGVRGITMRGPEGTRTVQFPTKLATVAETNQGLAHQELARRTLDDRLDKLESRFRAEKKKDVATTGAVALVIGGGLSAIGAFQTSNDQTGGSALANWASKDVTRMAAVVSVTQLATSGAKLAFNGRYIRSGFGIAADAFSLLQIGLFTFGTLHRPTVTQEADTTKGVPASFGDGIRVYDPQKQELFSVIKTTQGSYYIPAA